MLCAGSVLISPASQINKLIDRPGPIHHSSSHGRRRLDGAMILDEVIPSNVQANRGFKVLNLPAKAIRQSRQSADVRPCRGKLSVEDDDKDGQGDNVMTPPATITELASAQVSTEKRESRVIRATYLSY